ncbi:RHS repeat-associated core domain-containing protein, partial [Ruminiclostridium hungatei]|uniref:RHS repeat-associated core domain-containing protein n=1 Tax=Ruminiclostridium hungatei TaxID=48256 RepID=UPI0010568EA9
MTTSPAISSVTTSYTYNEQNRLVSTVQQSGRETVTEKYSYDSNGNTVAKRKETVKPADPEVTGSFSLSIAGRSSTSSEATYYQYDVWNQLAKTTAGSKIISYSYNGEGYRTAKTENGQRTNYLYEADRVILETDANGNETARNIYGINLLTRTAGSDTMNYMYNGHGDVTALLGEDGTVKGTYYYDAFGNIVEQTGNVNNNITYAGYQYDAETDLYYLNARYYDSKIARFLTQDTYTGDPNDPLSLNLYTYCHNEPVMYVDPTGNTAANLNDLALASGANKNDIKWNGKDQKTGKSSATVTVNGITKTIIVGENGTYIKDNRIVIDNETFDKLFVNTQKNSNVVVSINTTVTNDKISATQTVKNGSYTVVQTNLSVQTNN